MSADSKTQIVGTTGWAEQEREIERLNARIEELEDEHDKYKEMLIGEINRYTTLERSMAAPPKDILEAVCTTIEVLHDAITKHVTTGRATEMLRERLGISIRQGDTQPAGLLALMNYTFDLEESQMPARIKELYDECAALRDCPTHGDSQRIKELEAENEVFKSLYLNEQGRSESLRVDAERYRWLRKQEHPTSPESFWVARGGYGPVGISIWWLESLDEAIDAARGK